MKGAHGNTDSLHLMHESEFMSPHFSEEEKKSKKKQRMIILREGFLRQRMADVAVSRQCQVQFGGQAGREPQPPDSTRDNEGLSRHCYLLQQSTGTGRWTFSRERCMQLLGGPHLARGMRLVWVYTQKPQRQGVCIFCRVGACSHPEV